MRPTYSHTFVYSRTLMCTLVRASVCACMHAYVREGWQPCREISYKITGSHCRGSPLSTPPQPLRGRSLICNEPAPPVIILRLRDHVITRARINAIDLSHLSDSIKNVRFLGQFEFKDLRDSDEASVHLNSKIARIKFSSATN